RFRDEATLDLMARQMPGNVHPAVIRLARRPLPARAGSARRYALVAAFIGSLFITNAAWPQSCTPDFLITPTPNGAQHNRLKGVKAFDVNDVWTIGFTNDNNNGQTLTEHWDGSSWTIVPSPNPGWLLAALIPSVEGCCRH